jgi:hypothetical protein
MTPTILRRLWSLVENTQAHALLCMDDASLVTWIIEQLNGQNTLEDRETELVSNYIRTKTTLIRDLAAQR